MMRALIRSFAALAVLPCVASAQIQQQCFVSSFPITSTNFSNSISVPRFDPALGTLIGVGISFTATVQGSIGLENQGEGSITVQSMAAFQVALFRPNATTLAVAPFSFMFSDNLSGDDGTLDFGGSGGVTHPLASSVVIGGPTVPTSAADLALFTGSVGLPGALALPIVAQSSTSSTGGGANFISSFQTSAGAVLQVCYTFDPAFGVVVQKTSTAVVPGRVVEAFIGVTNTGGAPVTNLQVLVSVDPRFYRLLDVSPPGLAATQDLAALGIAAWTIPSIAPGDTRILEYNARLDSQIPLGTIVRGGPVWVGRTLVQSWLTCTASVMPASGACACASACLQDCAFFSCKGPPSGCVACSAACLQACPNGGLDCLLAARDAVVACFEASADIDDRFDDDTAAVGPFDPNEKRVVNGAIARPTDRLSYVVHYENIGTLAAKSVSVEDELDPLLDLSTLQILTAGGMLVPGTRTVRWSFPDIDLPPGGTDSVAFSAKPAPGIPPGSTVRNRARIGFESLPQIETNTVQTLLDNGRPNGTMGPLASVSPTSQITLGWVGTDSLSGGESLTAPPSPGVAAPPNLRFSVYVSENDGPYQPFVVETSSTSALFTGTPGVRYAFFCIAMDLAGNIEVQNPLAEASTLIGVSGTSVCAGDGAGTPCPCGNSSPAGSGAGCLNSLGMGGKLLGSGVASVAHDTFAITGTQMPNCPVVYFQGTSMIQGGNGTVFGDGLRCAGGTVIRLGEKVNVDGTSTHPLPTDRLISQSGHIHAGDVRSYQCWYRNAADFCTASTFNLTNALLVTWQP